MKCFEFVLSYWFYIPNLRTSGKDASSSLYRSLWKKFIDEEIEEIIFNDLEEDAAVYAALRCSYRGNVPKNHSWCNEVLVNVDDKRFKLLLRCSKQQFNVFLALIKNQLEQAVLSTISIGYSFVSTWHTFFFVNVYEFLTGFHIHACLYVFTIRINIFCTVAFNIFYQDNFICIVHF